MPFVGAIAHDPSHELQSDAATLMETYDGVLAGQSNQQTLKPGLQHIAAAAALKKAAKSRSDDAAPSDRRSMRAMRASVRRTSLNLHGVA